MIQPLQQPSDRLVDLRHRIKALVPESGYHPALYNLYADFGLGLVPGFRRPRRHNGHGIVLRHFVISAVQVGLVAASAVDSGSRVVWND